MATPRRYGTGRRRGAASAQHLDLAADFLDVGVLEVDAAAHRDAPEVRSLARRALKGLAGAADAVRRPREGLVVLLYHRVGARTPVSVDLPLALFDDQMAALAESGRATTLADALRELATSPVPSTAVSVTFDDGTSDFVDRAVPVLVRHRIPATLYVATAHVENGRSFPDDGRPASWAALAEAVSTGLVTIGSHTHSHALLDRIEPQRVEHELDRSIGLIEDRLGVQPHDFAYPKALPPSPTADRAVRKRFRSAALAGTRPNPPGADVHLLARSPIQEADGLRWFGRKLAGGMGLEDDLRRVADIYRHRSAVV